MAAHGCRHLPVVEGSRVVGFLSLRDLLRSDLEEKSSELELMNHYVHHVPRDVEQRLH
jgi:CBS domain-containing protein